MSDATQALVLIGCGQLLVVEPESVPGNGPVLTLHEYEMRDDGGYAVDSDYYYDGGHSFTQDEARALARVFRHFADKGSLDGFKDSHGVLSVVFKALAPSPN